MNAPATAPDAAPNSAPGPRPSRRKRRLLLGIGLLGVVLLLLALSLRVALQPENLTRVLLERVGKALALEITAGSGEYRLRGTPQLVLRDVVAREPGATRALLRARRIAVAVPWSTLRSRGALLEVERVELDAPVLDLPALQAWQAKRAPGETRIPTLTRGLTISNGRIDGDGWQVEGLRIDLPRLHLDQALAARVAGRYVDAPTRTVFDLDLALAKPALPTGAAAIGGIVFSRDGWSLPGRIRVSGPLHVSDGALRITPARIGLAARYISGDTRLPFVLGLHGPLLFRDATLALAPARAVLRGEGVLPSFEARGRIALGKRLMLELRGALPGWQDSWPALPPPLGQSDSPLPFQLDYLGAPGFDDPASLQLQRDATRFDGRFRFPEVLRWAGAEGDTSPLPPLDGRVTTPQLEVSGATLHGVEVEIDDPAIKAVP